MSTAARQPGPVEASILRCAAAPPAPPRAAPRRRLSLSLSLSLPLRLRPPARRSKLTDALRPASLTVANDSAKHAGHAGNPGGGADAETHFTVAVVAAAFEGRSLVARHRAVYDALGDEFAAGLHALAIKAKTPAEAEAAARAAPA